MEWMQPNMFSKWNFALHPSTNKLQDMFSIPSIPKGSIVIPQRLGFTLHDLQHILVVFMYKFAKCVYAPYVSEVADDTREFMFNIGEPRRGAGKLGWLWIVVMKCL